MSRVQLTLAYLLLASCGLGCQVPSYQLPGGFSSTYYRHLHGEFLPATSVETLEDTETNATPGVFYSQTFQFDPPTRSEFQHAAQVPENRPAGRRGYY